MTQLETKLIRTDGGTQARDGLNKDTVKEYRDLISESGGVWPFRDPIVVYHDGDQYWLADGFHRVHACWTNGRFVVEADIRQGTQRDAILHAAGANADHGLRRTAEDKKRAVLRLLEDAVWGRWSDREIARRCHVSPTFVGRVRGMLGRIDRPHHAPPPLPLPVHVDSDDTQRTYTRAGQTAVMNTDQIGQRKAKRGGLTKAEYTQVLVPDLVEFLRTYTDKHGRGWRQMQSVAAHTNSTPWQDITREWKRRQIYYEDETLKDAIKLAFDVLNSEQTAACAQCGEKPGEPTIHDGAVLCEDCYEEAIGANDYNYTAELEKSIEAAETAVSDPWVCGACAQEFGNEVDLLAHQFNSSCEEELKEGRGAGRASIVDSLKSTEWLIEEMMIQTKAPSPLFFALNTAVMAVREAMAVAIKLEETAVSQEAPKDIFLCQDCAMGTGAPSAGEPFVIRPLDWMIESENEEDEEAS